jgi:ribonuclease T2
MMKAATLALLPAVAMATLKEHNLQRNSTETGDLYVFAYSWQPEFCHDKSNYYGCEHPDSLWNEIFTIHGLWPQYQAGGYPSYCTNEAFDSDAPVAVGWETMTTYWPDVEYKETDPNYDEFWTHEWEKHGTCSGLTQYEYFDYATKLIQSFGTPAAYTAAATNGGSINADDLRDDFGGASMASLQCSSGSYINGVYTCWSTVNGVPTTQVECPSDVQSEDTCSSSTLTIVEFDI